MKNDKVAAFFKKFRSENSSAKRKNVVMTVLTIVALCALLISVTYSWFITAQKTQITPIEPGVYLPPSILIGSLKDNVIDWRSTLDLTTVYTISPVCGDGTHFFCDSEVGAGKDLVGFLNDNFDDVIEEGDGFTSYRRSVNQLHEIKGGELTNIVTITDFSIQLTHYGSLYLSTDSDLYPAFEQSPDSTYFPGMKISTGYIAGAVRVGIAQKGSDGSYHLKCVWIPNAKYQYDHIANTFTTNGEYESEYVFVTDVNGTKTTIKTVDYPAGNAVKDGVLYIWDLANCDVPFAEAGSGDDCDFRMIIWLDGYDRECENAFAGGRINVRLGIHSDAETE